MRGTTRIATIVCSILAGLIFIAFLAYLLKLCLRRRQARRLREFNDTAFDKVLVSKDGPKKLRLTKVLRRVTLLMPKTPGTPRSPWTPPKTPLFRRPSSRKSATASTRDSIRSSKAYSEKPPIPSIPSLYNEKGVAVDVREKVTSPRPSYRSTLRELEPPNPFE